jgi:hypothetical protein
MLILLSIWLAVGIGLMWMVGQKEPGSVGLPLAYFLGLSIIHVPGALSALEGEELNSMTTDGFEQTVIGMVAFLVGVITARYAFVPVPKQRTGASPAQGVSPQSLGELNRLALRYMCIGGVVYFAVMPFVGSIP